MSEQILAITCCLFKGERERENKKRDREDRVTAPLSVSVFLLALSFSLPPEVLPSRKYNGHSFVRVERHSKGHACNVLPSRRSMPTADSSRVRGVPTSTHISPHAHTTDFVEHEGRRVTTVWHRHASDVSREASTDRRFY